MPRQSTFNFIPAYQISKIVEPEKIRVSFSPKSRQLVFSRKSEEVASYPGRYVQLYADPEKKTMAWTFVTGGALGNLKHAVSIKLYGKSIVIAIPSSVCDALEMKETMKKVEVQRYKSTALLDNNDYHYITVK